MGGGAGTDGGHDVKHTKYSTGARRGRCFLRPGKAAAARIPAHGDAQNAKARLYQIAFQKVMSALDKYVSGEEFQMLKKQAAELREKKAY